MYQLTNPSLGEGSVKKGDRTYIPFDPENTDYRAFKLDLAQGAPLKDADGNAMAAAQITDFLLTLP